MFQNLEQNGNFIPGSGVSRKVVVFDAARFGPFDRLGRLDHFLFSTLHLAVELVVENFGIVENVRS